MAFNLGRSRSDIAGAQDSSLNPIQPVKVALPKFSGKNANELNSLAAFVEEKINSIFDFSKDLTSANTDAALERLHESLVKLKEASDCDNDELCKSITSDILEEVRKITLSVQSEKPKETIWSENDKKYLSDLIAASTLVEATEKIETDTGKNTGENGLTKDDINAALASTIKEQQILNNDVISTTEEANQLIKDSDNSEKIKSELQELFSSNNTDAQLDNIDVKSTTQYEKIQNLINSNIGRLNTHINIIGDNFKNSPIFNYKNPFSSAVGKIPTITEILSGTFKQLNDKIQNNIEKIKEPFKKISDGIKNIQAKVANVAKNIYNNIKSFFNFIKNLPKIFIEKIKNIFINILNKIIAFLLKPFELIKKFFKSIVQKLVGLLANIGKIIINGLKSIIFFIFKFIGSLFKKIIPKKKSKKSKKTKKDNTDKKTLPFLDKLKNGVDLSFKTIQLIAKTTVGLLKTKKPKKKKKKPVAGPKIPLINNAVPQISSADKKEKKKRGKFLAGIERFIIGIKNFFKNIAKHILDILGTIIIGICKLIAKGIGIIMRAIFMTPWGLIILASLLLISIGILLISLAVKKLVDFVVDDLGPIIKEKLKLIDPETLNRFINKLSTFVDVFTSILAGAFAPIIAIGTIIKNIIVPVGKLIKHVANVLTSILIPIITFIGEMIKIILVPIMQVLKIIIIAISKIITALMPVFQMFVNIIVNIVEHILKPIYEAFFSMLIPIIKIIGMVIKLIWAIVKPIFDIISGVILGILQVICAVMDVIRPIITDVIDVIIKGIVMAIKVVVDVVGGIIHSIWKFIRNPLSFIRGIINGIRNWLASFADKEIGVWKFKFKPFGFLKGLKTKDNSDEPLEVEDGKAQEIINDLQNRIKELQENYKKAQDQIKILNDKLKEAQSVKVDKVVIIRMQLYAMRAVKLIQNKVIPQLNKIVKKLNVILNKIKSFKRFGKNNKLNKIKSFKSSGKNNKLNNKKRGFFINIKEQIKIFREKIRSVSNTANKKISNKKQGFFANIKEKIKTVSNTANKVSSKIPSPVKNALKYTPFGFLGSMAKKAVNVTANKIKATEQKENNIKLDIAKESIQKQFKPINNINEQNKKNVNVVSENIEEAKNETKKIITDTTAKKDNDIANLDLYKILLKLTENVDINFGKINKKLDNPQIVPMPTAMNINNQALLGAQ